MGLARFGPAQESLNSSLELPPLQLELLKSLGRGRARSREDSSPFTSESLSLFFDLF
jgi:hypothetical protein